MSSASEVFVPVRDDGYQAYNPREPAEEGPGPVGYVALVAAWIAPGLGHIIIGQRARGVILGLTIYLLFAGGLFLGGIRAINPIDQPIWTYTQFLAGWPMLVCNRLEHASRAELGDATHKGSLLEEYEAQGPVNPDPQQQEAWTKAFIAAHPPFSYHPKIQDMGSVYCGIAGMLNLLVIFDVLLRITGSTREDPEMARRRAAPPDQPAASGGTT